MTQWINWKVDSTCSVNNSSVKISSKTKLNWLYFFWHIFSHVYWYPTAFYMCSKKYPTRRYVGRAAGGACARRGVRVRGRRPAVGRAARRTLGPHIGRTARYLWMIAFFVSHTIAIHRYFCSLEPIVPTLADTALWISVVTDCSDTPCGYALLFLFVCQVHSQSLLSLIKCLPTCLW